MYNNPADDQTATLRRFLLLLVLSLVVILAANITIHIVSGAPIVTLASAPSLVGQVAQSAGSTDSKITELSGYSLENTHYFDNNTWAVTKLVPPSGNGDNSTVILQKIGNFYQVVVGPGTSFPSNSTTGLPPDVANYLNSQGLTYNAG